MSRWTDELALDLNMAIWEVLERHGLKWAYSPEMAGERDDLMRRQIDSDQFQANWNKWQEERLPAP